MDPPAVRPPAARRQAESHPVTVLKRDKHDGLLDPTAASPAAATVTTSPTAANSDIINLKRQQHPPTCNAVILRPTPTGLFLLSRPTAAALTAAVS